MHTYICMYVYFCFCVCMVHVLFNLGLNLSIKVFLLYVVAYSRFGRMAKYQIFLCYIGIGVSKHTKKKKEKELPVTHKKSC